MEAALAELSIEDVKDEVDDKDFVVVRGRYRILITQLIRHISTDEEDVFESDFASTDEEVEAAQQASDTGDRLVKAEELKEKKVNFLRISSTRRITITTYNRQCKAASRGLLLLLTPVKR
jgi:hypothetical protein